jgi:hypothetical protein
VPDVWCQLDQSLPGNPLEHFKDLLISDS